MSLELGWGRLLSIYLANGEKPKLVGHCRQTTTRKNALYLLGWSRRFSPSLPGLPLSGMIHCPVSSLVSVQVRSAWQPWALERRDSLWTWNRLPHSVPPPPSTWAHLTSPLVWLKMDACPVGKTNTVKLKSWTLNLQVRQAWGVEFHRVPAFQPFPSGFFFSCMTSNEKGNCQRRGRNWEPFKQHTCCGKVESTAKNWWL